MTTETLTPREMTTKDTTPKKLTPLIVSSDLVATKAFYVRIGAVLVQEMEGYLHFRFGEGEDGPDLTFVGTQEDCLKITKQAHSSPSVMFSVPTPSVDGLHERLAADGIEILLDPENRPWGWRSFIIEDPNQVRLDFYETLPQSAAHAAS